LGDRQYLDPELRAQRRRAFAYLADVLQWIISRRTKNHALHALLPWNWHRCIAPLSSSPFCRVAASLPAILTRGLAAADPTGGAIDTATVRVDQELRDGRPQHQQPDAMDRPARGLQLPGAWRLARGA